MAESSLLDSSRVGLELLVCPTTGLPLRREGEVLTGPGGERWPIVGGIPRFVRTDEYVTSFSFEWGIHRKTQIDSSTGRAISDGVLREKTGLTPEQVRGKRVLDAGVGAGRFSEVLASWGAHVVAVDLSFAVETAQENLARFDQVLVVQADIGRLPLPPESFDFVISIGVLHHTPDTRAYFERLVPLLRPGGEICIWVYPQEISAYLVRKAWIPFTSRIPRQWFYDWCWCFHRIVSIKPDALPFQLFNQVFPWSNQGLGFENDVLDTFDGYSPRYHGVHSRAEVLEWFRAAGLEDCRDLPVPTAVRGRKPRG